VSGPAFRPYQKKILTEGKLSKSVWGRPKKKTKTGSSWRHHVSWIPFLFVLVSSTKRGTFKQMAAVAMDKNGNP